MTKWEIISICTREAKASIYWYLGLHWIVGNAHPRIGITPAKRGSVCPAQINLTFLIELSLWVSQRALSILGRRAFLLILPIPIKYTEPASGNGLHISPQNSSIFELLSDNISGYSVGSLPILDDDEDDGEDDGEEYCRNFCTAITPISVLEGESSTPRQRFALVRILAATTSRPVLEPRSTRVSLGSSCSNSNTMKLMRVVRNHS